MAKARKIILTGETGSLLAMLVFVNFYCLYWMSLMKYGCPKFCCTIFLVLLVCRSAAFERGIIKAAWYSKSRPKHFFSDHSRYECTIRGSLSRPYICMCVCVFHPHVQFYGGLGVHFKNKINSQYVNTKIKINICFSNWLINTFLECNNNYF